MGMGCIFDSCVDRTLPETNRSSHLKMDGLKTILSFWDGLFWQVRYVNFREGISCYFFGGKPKKPSFLFGEAIPGSQPPF